MRSNLTFKELNEKYIEGSPADSKLVSITVMKAKVTQKTVYIGLFQKIRIHSYGGTKLCL